MESKKKPTSQITGDPLSWQESKAFKYAIELINNQGWLHIEHAFGVTSFILNSKVKERGRIDLNASEIVDLKNLLVLLIEGK